MRIFSNFTQFYYIGSTAPAVLIDSGVVLSCCIHVFVSQNIGYQVYIAGFTVQAGTVGAAQLMRSDLFQRCNKGGILFYEVFDGADRDPAILQ
jgi:hypothetical protein